MLLLFLIITLIACILLVLIILAQNPKGGGLSNTFGGSMTSNVMGVKQTTNFLEKSTWYIAIGILVLIVFSNFFLPQKGQQQGQDNSRMKNEIENLPAPMPQQQNQMPTNQRQGGGTPQQRQGGQQQNEGQGAIQEDDEQ